MTLTHTAMRRMKFCLMFLRTRAPCPLLSLLRHPLLCVQARCYQRPGISPRRERSWKNFSLEKVFNSLKHNLNLMFKELDEHLFGPEGKPLRQNLLEQTTVLWEFRSPKDLEKWMVSSDLDVGGKSQAYLKSGRNEQTALFYGVLNTEVPRDGETTASGYCTLRSRPLMGAFGRRLTYDWLNFNVLHLRVRGDGRPWMLNIQSKTGLSSYWDDLYHYFIYTRGGPHWQDIKIPLSKFFISSRGRVQDGQHALMPDQVTTFGFTLADRTDGPFQLEIDFIGLCKDRTHTEECAYEMYKVKPM